MKMLKKSILILLCTFSLCAQESDFGKTHFIVGYPHHKQKTFAIKEQPKKVIRKQRVLFSPDDNIKQELLDLINNEQERIQVAVYSFTDKVLANALIAAKKRGIEVEVITDPTQYLERYNKTPMLKDNGVSVLVYQPNHKKVKTLANLMHNKFAIFFNNKNNQSIVWTGSLNWTVSAQKSNQENIIVLYDRHVVERYQEQFGVLKKRCRMVAHRRNEILFARSNNSKLRKSGILARNKSNVLENTLNMS